MTTIWKRDRGTGIGRAGRDSAVIHRPAIAQVTGACALVEQFAVEGRRTGSRGLVEGEVGLDAIDDPQIAGDGCRIRAAAGIGHLQGYIVIAGLRVGMCRILLIGGAPVAKGPDPGGDGALSRGGPVGELNGSRGASQGQIRGELWYWIGVNRNVIGLLDGIRATRIPDDELDREGPRGGVGMTRILQTRGLAIAEVPTPESGFVGRIVCEINVQRTAACGRGSGKTGDRSLGHAFQQAEDKAGNHK